MSNTRKLLKSPKFYLVALIAFIVLDALFLKQVYKERSGEFLKSQSHLFKIAEQSVLHGFANNADLLFENVINKPVYQELIAEANNASDERKQQIRNLIFDALYPLYSSMDKFKLKQFHFHLQNNHSFLRFHRPNKFGDDLSDVRASVAYVNRTGQPIQGFEEGRIFNGYRFVFPIFWNHKQVGSVETSVSMKVVMDEVSKELNGATNFIIRRGVVESKVFKNEQSNYDVTPFSADFMYEGSSMTLNSRLLFNEILSQWNKDDSIADLTTNSGIQSRFLDISGQRYQVSLMPIDNAVDRKNVGFMLFYKQSHQSDLVFWQFIIAFIVSSLVAALMLFLLYRSQRNEAALSDSQDLLHRNIERFEKTQQIASLGTWEYDLNTQSMYWSDEVFRIFGEEPRSFAPAYDRFLAYAHPEDREELDYAFRYSLAHGTPFCFKHRILRKDGSIIYVEEECEHKTDEHGMALFSLGSIHDVHTVVERENELERLGERYQSLVERLPNLVYRFEWSEESRWIIRFMNASALQFTGCYANELAFEERNLLELVHPDDRERVEQHIFSAIESNKGFDLEYRLQKVDGSVIYVHDTGQKVFEEHKTWQVEGVMTDISSQKRALDKLQKFIDTQKSIVILTDGHLLSFANRAYFQFFAKERGSNSQELLAQRCICDFFETGEHIFDLSHQSLEDRHWIDAILHLPPGQRNVAMKNANGDLFTFAVEINQFDDKNYVVTFSDISDSFMEKLMWRQKASIDSLTGAYNRYFFELSIISFMKLVHRNNQVVGLIMMDIDHFKSINDRFGHAKGDDVLRSITSVIRRNLRDSDLLIRWGGEEFLLVISVENSEGVERVANILRSKIEQENYGSVGSVTCSFGGTLVTDLGDVEDAIQRADEGLYHVKSHGRNGFRFVPLKSEVL